MAQAIDPQNASAALQPPPLRISRDLHAPRATVFAAWGSADHVRNWFAPAPYTAPEAIVEQRVGGRFEVCMRAPDGTRHWTRGTFIEVTPHSRLVLDLHATDSSGRKLFNCYTEVDFGDALCGTRLTVTQTYTVFDPITTAPMIAGAPLGWSAALEQMEQVVLRLTGAQGLESRSVAHGTFHLERRYKAPIARVWQALTDEAAKQKWFGGTPGEWELIERHLDVREGGTERLHVRWASGVVSAFDAIYHDVVPGQRLVYSYVMHMNGKKISASLATLQLADDDGATRLSVTEQGAFLDGYDDAGSREHGTGQLLDLLGASLKD